MTTTAEDAQTDETKPARAATAKEVAVQALELAQRAWNETQNLGALGGDGDRARFDQFARENAELSRVLHDNDAKLSALTRLLQNGQDAVLALANRVTDLEQATLKTEENLGERVIRLEEERRTASSGYQVARGGIAYPLTQEPPQQAIHGEMAELMRKVTHLGKDAIAPATMGGFKYRRLDDAMDVVGRAMRELGILLSTEILDRRRERWEAGSKVVTSVEVTTRYTFRSSTDGSTYVAEMVGEGRDFGDKATSKATSMCLKYMLITVLMIPVESLPDSDGEAMDQRQAPSAPARTGPRESQPYRDAQAQAAQAQQRPPARAAGAANGSPAASSSASGERRPLTTQEAAQRVYDALQHIDVVPPAERVAKVDAIEKYARAQEGLMGTTVDGVAVAAWIASTRRTLTGGAPLTFDGQEDVWNSSGANDDLAGSDAWHEYESGIVREPAQDYA